MISNNKFSHDEYGYPRTNEEIRLLEQNEQSYNIIKRLQSQIASLESQLREKEEHYRKLEVVANRWHNEYLRLESEKDEEIQSCIEQRDNVLNDFELYRAEKDKEIERLKEQVKDQYYDKFHGDVYFGELREALRESELQAQVAITGNDILDSENKQMKIAIKDFLLFIESGKGEYPTILLSRCRKLIRE